MAERLTVRLPAEGGLPGAVGTFEVGGDHWRLGARHVALVGDPSEAAWLRYEQVAPEVASVEHEREALPGVLTAIAGESAWLAFVGRGYGEGATPLVALARALLDRLRKEWVARQ